MRVGFVRIGRYLDDRLELEEALAGQHLPKSHERLHDHGSLAEPVVLVTSGELHFPSDAEDRPLVQVVIQGSLKPYRHISHASVPIVAHARLLSQADGHLDLELVAGAEPTLIYQLVHNRSRSFDVYLHGRHRFVFGIRLLGDQRPRQVQLAARPRPVGAECADVVDDGLQLLNGEGFAERGHGLVESPNRTTLVGHGNPIAVWLARRKTTIGEIRHGNLEGHGAGGRALAIRSVASRAGGFIQSSVIRGNLEGASPSVEILSSRDPMWE